MTRINSQRGFILVTVLIVTAVGLLFGAGALLLFRYQCQQRIDRQHELEKVCAVRSALNYIRRETVVHPGVELGYHTWSGRDLKLIVKPAKTIFPTNNLDQVTAEERNAEKRHFVMEWGDFNALAGVQNKTGGYNPNLDYAYGAEGVTDLSKAMKGEFELTKGLVLNYSTATGDAVRCWVNIGMGDSGGWLQEEYGRRYCFYPQNIVPSDVVRLWLIRAPMNVVGSSDGRSLGWPPSNDERSLMLELTNGREARLWECRGLNQEKQLCECFTKGENYMGIQLAHNKASLYFIGNEASGATMYNVLLRGFSFSNVATLSEPVYEYFSSGCEINSEGKIVRAPEMRAVFEIESSLQQDADKIRVLKDFKVTPGYQYDIFVKYPGGDPILATVAQRMGEYTYSTSDLLYSILTYDTHGTEHKGFRWEEERNGR